MSQIRFRAPGFPALQLPDGAPLVVHLDVRNSPVLFGCRTGLCGTCLARVEGTLPPPSAEEREVLDILAPGDTKARLLCQLSAQDDLCIEAIVP